MAPVSAQSSPAFDDAARPIVNSFDIFDTLIARRCFEALRIHEQVEVIMGAPGFAQYRRVAEISMSGDAYTLDDIYREIGHMQGFGEPMLERLKQAEIDAELENVIPIADNMALVRDGDILISDMYLSEAVVRQLLRKAGFDKNVGIYISAHGKASGQVWPKILRHFRIDTHLGDNRVSDIESPRAHGIAAHHTGLSAPIETEAWLMQIGLRDVALLCREARLTTFCPDHVTRQLVDIQTSMNFPMLLLASVPLAHLVQKKNLTRILFSSRDAELWSKLFRKFAAKTGLNCESDYFYTSRLARRAPSPDYMAYARDRLSGSTLLLDLCGTGWSVAHLVKKMGLEHYPVFMLIRCQPMSTYEQADPTPDVCEFHSIIGPDDPSVGNSNLELVNAAPYGSVVDVKLIDGVAMPVLDADRRPADVIELVRRQFAVIDTLLAAMDRHEVANLMTLEDGTACSLAATFARYICGQRLLQPLFMAAAIEEDNEVYRRLEVAIP